MVEINKTKTAKEDFSAFPPIGDTMQLLHEGNEKIWTQVHGHFNSRMVGAATRKLRNPALAEEAVQEAWFGVSRMVTRFNFDPSNITSFEQLKGYLLRSALNGGTDTVRIESRQTGRNITFADTGDIPDKVEPIDEVVHTKMTGKNLFDALPRLFGEDHAEVLLWVAVGNSGSVISQRLGIPEGTIKARIHSARNKAVVPDIIGEVSALTGQPVDVLTQRTIAQRMIDASKRRSRS